MTSTISLLIMSAALNNGVDYTLLKAIALTESGGKNVITYNDGDSHSYGVMQVKLSTAKMFDKKATAKKLMKAEYNVDIAAKYLKWQIARYNNDTYKAIAAYNSGSVKYKKGKHELVNSPYVKKVAKNYAE